MAAELEAERERADEAEREAAGLRAKLAAAEARIAELTAAARALALRARNWISTILGDMPVREALVEPSEAERRMDESLFHNARTPDYYRRQWAQEERQR